MKKILFITFILLAGFAMAADFTPQGNINLRDTYNITGAPYVNATLYYGNASQMTGVAGVNSSFNQTLTDLLYAGIEWDYNQTIPANSYTDAVNVSQTSWIDTFFVRFTEIVGLVGNWSADKSDYYTSTQTDTEIETANTSMKNYADGTFITQANEGNLNVNSSTWWATISGYASKWFYNSGNELTLNETQLNSSIEVVSKNWTTLQNYPVACPAGTYLTALNDSVTCTSVSGGIIIDDISLGGKFYSNESVDSFYNFTATSINTTITPIGTGITSSEVNANNETWLAGGNITIPDNSVYDFGNFTNITIIIKAKCKELPSESKMLWVKTGGGIALDSFYNIDGRLVTRQSKVGTSIVSSYSYCDNESYEFAIVNSRNGTGGLGVYSNGYLDTTGAAPTDNLTNSLDLTIGYRPAGNILNGSIYYTEVYTSSFNSSEVLDNFLGYKLINKTNTNDFSLWNDMNNTDSTIISSGTANEFDDEIREPGNILFNETGDETYKFTFTGFNGTYADNNTCIGWANSTDGITWAKQGKLFDCGSGWGGDVTNASEDPFVIYNGSQYFLYVEDKSDYPSANITLYTSTDFLSWEKQENVLSNDDGEWDGQDVSSPTLFYENGIFYMLYEGRNWSLQTGQIGLATSTDGINWVKDLDNPFIIGNNGYWDTRSLVPDDIIKKDSEYYLTYHAFKSSWNNGFIKTTNLSDKDSYYRPFDYPINTEMYMNDNSNVFVVDLKLSYMAESERQTYKLPDTSLISQYNFNENNGTTAHDSSGNSNDGTIEGAIWTTDGILVTLAAITDYTINPTTGLFTIVNDDYLYSWLEINWTANSDDYLFKQDLSPETNSLYSIGSSILRWFKGWFVDLDVSGEAIIENATITNLNVTSGYTGTCANTTYSGGIAISCND